MPTNRNGAEIGGSEIIATTGQTVKRVAALYVQSGGVYDGLDGVDPWTVDRDARTYAGPWPVVAHPPCERWGRYWSGGPSSPVRKTLGDDGGCFAAALAAVRRFGGVLEHPEASHAWRAFGLPRPHRAGGWTLPDDAGGSACCVEQGHYGHRARKATWLYAVGVDLPSLTWGPAPIPSTDRTRTGWCQRASKRQRAATPSAFRDVLLSMARTVEP